MSLYCCELVRRGRFVVAEPFFEGGPHISLASAKRYAGNVHELVVVAAGTNVGRVVEVLGPATNIHAVLRGLLAEAGCFGFPHPGTELGASSIEVQNQLAEIGDAVPIMERRTDLRGQLAVTIDPPGAKDFDDAVAFVPSSAGGMAGEVWVHIADVSAFVPEGSPLDEHAAERAFSAYVPGQVAPMLPHELSSNLCSLRPGVDRGCVSVCIYVSSDGDVERVRFVRSVMRSARRLTYDQVDEVLANRGSIDPMVDELLGRLDALTRMLRQRRVERGALEMSIPEVAFELGTDAPTSARLDSESPSHRLVEECMLLANNAVGVHLADIRASALFRNHDHPDPPAVEQLLRDFDRLNVPTPALPDDLSPMDAARIATEAARMARRYSAQSGRGVAAYAPRVLRSLSQAVYRAKPGFHSGLATANYAHFTSPIRRYPDLVNHRALLASIGYADEATRTHDLDSIADHCNTVERDLVKLERRADDIVLAHLLYRRQFVDHAAAPATWNGEVVGMIGSGLFVRFGDVFEGFLPARTLARGGDRYNLDEYGLAMVGRTSGHRITLGDRIDVVVERIERAAGKVTLHPANWGETA